MKTFRNILITGASSGIGAGLAQYYAAPGVTLHLSGRNPDRLRHITEQCESQGATVESRVLDVVDSSAMAAWVTATDAHKPLDLVIANAGVGGGSELDLTYEKGRYIIDVNVMGVINTVLPIQSRMQERQTGQIAIVSSFVAFHGFSGAGMYCATKAAVKVFGESLRGSLASYNVGVSVICPGFVESNITKNNNFYMPLLMPAEKAAPIIAKGLARNKALIVFPWPTYIGVRLLSLLPSCLKDRLSGLLPRKN